LLDKGDLGGGQRVVFLRHAAVFVFGDERLKEGAIFGFAGDEDGLALHAFGERLEVVELKVAFGFLFAVTGDAFLREDRRDVIGEADCGEDRLGREQNRQQRKTHQRQCRKL
jgi:hypothetical protein